MFLRFRFVFPLLIAAVVTACSNTGTPPKADIHPANNSAAPSVSPLIELMREAQAGNAKAQHTLADKYQRGEGVPKDLAKSAAWEQKSAALGYAEAQAQLADDYYRGFSVPENQTTAVNWAEKAAAQENAEAQFTLGIFYISGQGVRKDIAKAVELLQKSAAQGNVNAQLSLGRIYSSDNLVAKDTAKSIEWYRKAAMQGSTSAQWELSICYASGNSCPKDSVKAAEWYQKAWLQGDADSQWSIGNSYSEGFDDHPKDAAKAIEWYQRAAAHGKADVQWNLGQCYGHVGDEPCPKDSAKAIEWYEKAAAQGDANLQWQMGQCYGLGIWGCPKDAAKAAEWYEKAAAQGNPDLQYQLGECFGGGDSDQLGIALRQLHLPKESNLGGCSTDNAKAIQWLQRAAAQGNADAEYTLGYDYENGYSLIKDAAKAVELYQKSATQGDRSAQSRLAKDYFTGAGVVRNWVLAYAWANLSASQGGLGADRDARFRDALEGRMTQAQIAEAQQLTARWKPGVDLSQGQSQHTAAAPPKLDARPTMQGTGTIFVVDPTGLAVTNEHVVKGCLELRLKGRDGTLKIVAEDSANDLALVQLPNTGTAATIAESNKLRQGDDIAVFGFPLNGVLAVGGNLTTGVISGLTGPRNNTAQFQITAAIQPGSSGSPVINDEGDVIGVVSSKLSDEVMARATGSVGESVNFAISAQELKAFLEANRVTYATGDGHWYAPKQAPVDIADAARKWTFMVECWK